MEKLRSVLVTDRTQTDVNARNDKGTYNYTDLNRVLRACAWLAEKLEQHGYEIPFGYCETCLIAARAQPEDGGTVRGDIKYPGEEAIVRATPAGEHEFIWWEENGKVVSQSAEYRFTAERPRDLTALFLTPDDPMNGVTGIGHIGTARVVKE